MLGSWGRFALAAITVGLALAGCTTETTPPVQAGPPTKVQHPKAELPRDRDDQAVLAALRKLDACALLDPAAAGVPGFPADLKPWSEGPHRCMITRKDGDDEVTVRLGEPLDSTARFGSEPVALGAAKGYVAFNDPHICEVHLPVSFTRTIEFRAVEGVESSGNDRCAAAKGFATAAAAKLADPDAITAGATMPMAQWDACGVLRGALGGEGDRYTVDFDDGIDNCRAQPTPPDYLKDLFLLLYYSVPPGGGRTVSKGNAGEDTRKVKPIGGREVYVDDTGSGCLARWNLGRSGSAGPHSDLQFVERQVPDCARVEQRAASVIQLMSSAPPAGAAPQRPLIYRTDQADLAAAGACVVYPGGSAAGCEPHLEVAVPAGRTEATRAAHADPNVSCALARDVVRTQFGDRLVPVTAGTGCVFVEPTHTIRVEISVDSVKKLVRPVDSSDAIALAGHQGYARERTHGTDVTYSVDVAISDSSQGGVLSATARFFQGRSGQGNAAPETGGSGKLQSAVADIMARSFG